MRLNDAQMAEVMRLIACRLELESPIPEPKQTEFNFMQVVVNRKIQFDNNRQD